MSAARETAWMGSRERAVDIGAARARESIARLMAEARSVRLQAGVSQSDVAEAIGISRSQLSRMERGMSPDLTLDRTHRLFAVLGMDLSVRSFPGGDPLRDAAHAALLERLHVLLHGSFRWQTEVPLPIVGDRRAWDATATSTIVRIGIEAETRVRDVQAMDRRLALKIRDGRMDRLVLLIADTRANRSALSGAGDVLRIRCPIPGRQALDRLATGLDPGGSSLILL